MWHVICKPLVCSRWAHVVVCALLNVHCELVFYTLLLGHTEVPLKLWRSCSFHRCGTGRWLGFSCAKECALHSFVVSVEVLVSASVASFFGLT
jgi:hypothetical protein